MRKHQLYATRKQYQPFHPTPAGEVLLALRPRLSPFFSWDHLETVDVDGQRIVSVNERQVSEHYVRHYDVQPWHTTILQKCDGTRTTLEIFLLQDVQAAIPAEDIDAKLDVFGSLMEMFAAQELILCEP